MSGSAPSWWSAALIVLAVALVVTPGPVAAARRVAVTARPPVGCSIRRAVVVTGPRRRWAMALAAGVMLAGVAPSPAGAVLGAVLTVVVAVGLPRWRARRARDAADPLTEAAAWDQLAACLRAGLPLDRAVRAVAPVLPATAGAALRRVADLVALGADPVNAWEPALDVPATARLARAARRSARSGAAVADVATTVADDVRSEAADAVSARAERAGVLVTGPLGLCFLPAFLALGVVPVVVGLAGPLLAQR